MRECASEPAARAWPRAAERGRATGFLTVLLLCPPATALGPETLPPGTALEVRLTTTVSSRDAVGEPVEGMLIAPVRVAGGRAAVAPGARLRGTVVEARYAGLEHPRAVLRLSFTEMTDTAGRSTAFEGRVVEVDNARETVDPTGRILGLPPVAPHGAIEDLLLLAAHAHPGAFLALGAEALVVREAEEVDITYLPGVELTLTLEQAVSVNAPAASDDDLLPAGVDPLVNALPFRTVAARFQKPSDVTNVLLVGTREQVEAAFAEAGWVPALSMSVKAAGRAFVALAERHGYKEAPVSLLELEGRPPGLVFEKQNDTLAKRHHVRIWSRPERLGSGALWVGAATHDVGIAFDRVERTFVHRIDSQIDRERTKLADDLVFTGRVAAEGLVDRPLVPRNAENATGDRIETDGRLAVLVLRD